MSQRKYAIYSPQTKKLSPNLYDTADEARQKSGAERVVLTVLMDDGRRAARKAVSEAERQKVQQSITGVSDVLAGLGDLLARAKTARAE